MRLVWWREAVDAIFSGRAPRRHPAAQAMEQAIRRRNLPREPLEAMIEARIRALETSRFGVLGAVEWADAVGGSAAFLAARVLDPDCPADAVQPAGRAWGLALLRRSGVAAGSEFDRALFQGLHLASEAARRLSVAAFPAALHVTLVRCDLASRTPGELEKRLRLSWAAARGRL